MMMLQGYNQSHDSEYGVCWLHRERVESSDSGDTVQMAVAAGGGAFQAAKRGQNGGTN